RRAVPLADAVSLDDLPAALHAQMAAEDEPVLEAQEQFLPDGAAPEQAPAVEALRHAGDPRARVRRLDGDLLSDEHLQATRRAVQGDALWHTESVCILAPEP